MGPKQPKHQELVTTLVAGYSPESDVYFLISLNAKRFWNVPKTQMQRHQIQIGDCCILNLADENITGMTRKTKKLGFNVAVVTGENRIIVENVVGRVEKQQRMIYFHVENFDDVAFIGDDDRLMREDSQPGTEWKLRLRLLREEEKIGFLRAFDWGADFFDDEIPQLESRRTTNIHQNHSNRQSRSRTRENSSSHRSQSRKSNRSDSSGPRYEWNDRGRNTSRDQNKRRNERSQSAGPLRRNYQNGSQHGLNQYGSRDDSRQGRSSRTDNAKERKRSKSAGNDTRRNPYGWQGSNASLNTSYQHHNNRAYNSNNGYMGGQRKNSSNFGGTDQRSRSNLRKSSESIRSGSKHNRPSSKAPSTSNTISNKPRILLITAVQNFNNQQKFWLWDVENRSEAFCWGVFGNDALKVGHFFEGIVYNISQPPECKQYIRSLDGSFPEVKTKNIEEKIEVECSIVRYNAKKKLTYHELFGDIIAPNSMIPRRQWNQLRINIYITRAPNGVGSVWRMNRIITPEQQLIDEFRAVWTHQLFRKQIQCDVYHDSDLDSILDNYYNAE